MPNTLAHLGVQSLATRTVLRDADYRWIYLGCIIPDLPWMLQRFVRVVFPAVDPYDLRLYAVVQASWAFCLLLSVAFATLAPRLWKVFAVLGLNSFLHLLIDACQTKWANGVHFLAPTDWKLVNFGLFWPESIVTTLLTVAGLALVLLNWRRSLRAPFRIVIGTPARVGALVAALAAYAALPLLFMGGPEAADNHFVGTLRAYPERPGRHLEIDRASYVDSPSGDFLHTFAGEDLTVTAMDLDEAAATSVKGTFVTPDSVRIDEYHVHNEGFRQAASYSGLAIVAALWTWSLARRRPGRAARP